MKSLPDTPKVSIITMTYNDCAHLEKCVTQILKQDFVVRHSMVKVAN